jgi:hypothetical protein
MKEQTLSLPFTMFPEVPYEFYSPLFLLGHLFFLELQFYAICILVFFVLFSFQVIEIIEFLSYCIDSSVFCSRIFWP